MNILNKISCGFKSRLIEKERTLFLQNRIKKLKNENPSIISSNCNGGIISHDLGLKFMSPTVNLWVKPNDFLKIMSNPRRYFSTEPIQVNSYLSYPVGKVCDIEVFFQHYDTFDDARKKWVERSKRVDYNNMFFLLTERDGCTINDIERFDAFSYENKVVFTHVPYLQYKSSFYIRGFEDNNECGILSDFREGWRKRRYIDDFDVVSFLNGKQTTR